MRKADKRAIENGVTEEELISRAGMSIAETLAERFGKDAKILFVTGKGNNGKDGLVCADVLRKKGYGKIDEYRVADMTADMRDDYDVIVDCVFGTGLKSALSGNYKKAIELINDKKGYKVSVDVPSGLNSDNGKVAGVCVKADLTIAIGELKLGYFLNDGKDYTGEIEVKDVGIDVSDEDAVIFSEKDVVEKLPKRKENSNKGSYGKVTIIGGSKKYVGGSLLTLNSLSVIKSGAGYTAILVPESLYSTYVARVLEAVTFTGKDDGETFVKDFDGMDAALGFSDVICYGNGIGVSRGVYDNLTYILKKSTKKVLIDADGLNVLSEYGVGALKEKNCEVLLTPHIKEFSRLTGKSVEDVCDNPVGLAKEFAKEYGVTVALKSNSTVITDGEKVALNVNGNDGLAKAGSGDVLSGLIAGLMTRLNCFDSAVAGTYIFGYSADKIAEKTSRTTLTPLEVISGFSDFFKKAEKI